MNDHIVPAGPPSIGEKVLLEVDRLGKTYGQGPDIKHAIEDVSLTVHEREFVCIVGPSGAGKTTLLNCLIGLMPATTGRVQFQGEDVTGPPRGIAVVFQDYARSLFPWFTVERNISFPLEGKGIPAAEVKRRVAEAITAVGLGGSERRHPDQLSGGMQQRVAIARALAYQPSCLVMDEPFASVDAQTRFELEDLLLEVRNQYGCSVLFVTHDIDEAVYLSDRVFVLTRSPAQIRAVIENDLARPRDQLESRRDPRFAELRTELLALVQSQVAS